MGHCVITSYSNGTTSHMSWWLRCWVSDTCSTYWLIQFIIILNYILSLFINLVLMCILICHSSIMAANILRIPLPVLWHFNILKNHVLQCHMLCILQCHILCILQCHMLYIYFDITNTIDFRLINLEILCNTFYQCIVEVDTIYYHELM